VKKKYIFVTNIPTPYRNAFYNHLHDFGLNFEVYYQRAIEADRDWVIDYSNIRYKYSVDRGFYKQVGRFHFHFNLGILRKLMGEGDADFILGLNWNDFDMLVLVFLRRLHIVNNRFHFWSEANYQTIGARNDNFLKRMIRRFVYNLPNCTHLSSGQMTEVTLKKWGIKVDKFVPLPNTIEEDLFHLDVVNLEGRRANSNLVFFMPVRLNESVKGIINFFRCIGVENSRKCLFLIAGDGPDKLAIQSYISCNNLDANIKLLGHLTSGMVADCYRKSNVFVLPSFSDPSPLSVYEAMSMGLPLLISNRCGNHFEAVNVGVNGYVFDPSDSDSVRESFEIICSRSLDLEDMGKVSLSIYQNNFGTCSVIENFVNGLHSVAEVTH
jgi:glycosyltransferase involved in cell wall biosynthesis